jgi:two-component system alkaline phosphatase synthesis response regulator PhoP
VLYGARQERARVLLLEDKPVIATMIRELLNRAGAIVHVSRSGDDGMAAARATRYDLIIVDIALPDRDGLEICRELRGQDAYTALLLITGATTASMKVAALKCGADDCVTLPWNPEEFLARIEVLLRRSAMHGQRIDFYETGHLRFDFKNSEFSNQGQCIELSEREVRLLRYLIRHRGELVTRQELLTGVWGYSDLSYSRTVDVHMVRLRRKIEIHSHAPSIILTVYGRGYRFAG